MVALLSAGYYALLNIVNRLLANEDSRLPQATDATRLHEVGRDFVLHRGCINIDALLRQPHAVVALGIVAVVHDVPPSYCQSLDQLDYSINHIMPNAYIPENLWNLDSGSRAGVLGCWGAGVLVCWGAGVLGCWGAGVQPKKISISELQTAYKKRSTAGGA